jgi:lysozyme
MKINVAGLALIKAHEGRRLEAYKDPVGIWTIGYGHTSAAGAPKVSPGMKITEAEAERILRNDLAKFERAVADAVSVPLNDNQFSALVSFCFNVGPGGFRRSSVLRCVNDRQFDLVPGRLALWNKGGGKVLRGLVRRRMEEGELFMAPVAPQEPAQPQEPVLAGMVPMGAKPAPEPDVKPERPKSRWQKITGAIGVAVGTGVAWFHENIEIVIGLGVVAAVVVGVVIWRGRRSP